MPMIRWEYKSLIVGTHGIFAGGRADGGEIEQELNSLGAKGWELVSAYSTQQAEGRTRDMVMILKRPVE